MVKDITITDLQKKIKSLESRIEKLELLIKNNKNETKKVKDPDAPKKSISAYMFFSKHKIDDYKKKHPDQKIKVTEISKQSAQEWKLLKDDEKDKFLKLANKDKKRYEKEIAIYNKN
jgi:structure-specific recognition protein 1